MRRVHLIVGVVGIGLFVLSGQYMDRALGHLDGMADGPRLMFRTRHIFLLLSSLTHLLLAVYIQPAPQRERRLGQYMGSALITLSTVLFAWGFWVEPLRGDLESPQSHWATYAIAVGVGAHLLAVPRGGSRS